MKIIRWSFVIPTVIILAAIIICTTLFLDNIIKNIIISSTQMVTGTKVEIGSLKTSFKNCSILIYNFKVADKDNEFSNALDIEKISFDMKFTPLLRKKVVIDNMAVVGLKTQTKRTTSGKLPKKFEDKYKKKEKKDSKISKLLEKAKTKTTNEVNQLPSVEAFNEIQSQINNFDVDRLIDKANLESIKQIDALSKDVQEKYKSYQTFFNDLNLNAKIEDSKKIIDEISKTEVKGLGDVLKVAQKVDELTKKKKDFDEILNKLNSAQKDISKTLDFSKQVKSSVEKDINSISQQLSIPNLNVKNISKMLFGNKWVNIVEKAMYYISIVKEYMPKKSETEKKVEVAKRQKGRDIIFKQKQYPTLLIYVLNLSGTTATPTNMNGIDFAGIIKNISSSPSMVSEPIILDVSGNKGIQSLKIEGLFDHRIDKSKDVIKVNLGGVSGTMLNIPQNDYLPLVDTATTNIAAAFSVESDDINCSANILFKDIKEKDVSKLDSTMKILAQVTNSIKTFSVNATAKVVNDDMDISISSDIDKKISGAISNVFSSKVNEVKAKLNSELNKIVADKTKEIEASLSSQKDGLLNEIKKNTSVVNDFEKIINEAIKKK